MGTKQLTLFDNEPETVITVTGQADIVVSGSRPVRIVFTPAGGRRRDPGALPGAPLDPFATLAQKTRPEAAPISVSSPASAALESSAPPSVGGEWVAPGAPWASRWQKSLSTAFKFFEESVAASQDAKVYADELYKAYETWCAKRRIPAQVRENFARCLRAWFKAQKLDWTLAKGRSSVEVGEKYKKRRPTFYIGVALKSANAVTVAQ